MSRQRWVVLAVVLLLAIHAGLLAYSATRHSPTMLEPALLAAGLSHWEFGRFELYRVNPPLVRMVAALPVLAAGYESDWSSFYEAPGARPEFAVGADFIKANGERSIWLMTIARWACIPFSLIGGLFAFAYSRELWQSTGAGLVTLTVWCFEPNILAHAELITNDVACTSFGIGATWLFWRWLKQPTWGRAALAGLVLGLAQLTKSSWLFLFGLWPILAGIWWWAERRRVAQCQPADANELTLDSTLNTQPSTLHSLLQLTGLLALALYVLNLGYVFDGSFTRLKDFEFISTSLTGLETSGDVGNRFRDHRLGELPVPFPRQYVLGIDSQKHDFESWSRPSYLRGEWKQGGWWYYYLYGLWVKVPHGVQLLVLMACLYPLWRWLVKSPVSSVQRPEQEETAAATLNSRHSTLSSLILLAPGLTLFILVSSQTKMNEHFRYVLPTIGTLAVCIGHTFVASPRGPSSPPKQSSPSTFASLFAMRPIIHSILLTIALLEMIGSTLRTYPHQLAHFNKVAGGPVRGHEHLLGSSYDWGQCLLDVKSYLRHERTPVVLCGRWTYDPADIGVIGRISARDLKSQRMPKTEVLIVVSVSHLKQVSNFVRERQHNVQDAASAVTPEYLALTRARRVDSVGYIIAILSTLEVAPT